MHRVFISRVLAYLWVSLVGEPRLSVSIGEGTLLGRDWVPIV